MRSTGLDAVPELIERARESGMDVELQNGLKNDGARAGRVGRAAYRVVQEALTNVSKHAPGAHVTVRMGETGDTLWITIVNTAASARSSVEADRGGSGLRGLAERVRMVG